MSFDVKIGKIHHQVTKKRRTRIFENKKREGHEDFRRHKKREGVLLGKWAG